MALSTVNDLTFLFSKILSLVLRPILSRHLTCLSSCAQQRILSHHRFLPPGCLCTTIRMNYLPPSESSGTGTHWPHFLPRQGSRDQMNKGGTTGFLITALCTFRSLTQQTLMEKGLLSKPHRRHQEQHCDNTPCPVFTVLTCQWDRP